MLMVDLNKIYILPFDHRSNFEKVLPDPEKIKEGKWMIYQAFLKVRNNYPQKDIMAILVDYNYGKKVLDDAKINNVKRLVSVEKSGNKLFDFELENWQEMIKEVNPYMVKVLVRYNPVLEEKENNKIQLDRLEKVSKFCEENNYPFLFELLTGDPLKTAKAIEEIRPRLKVAIWKLEGADDGKWEEIIKQTKEDKIVFLGRGNNNENVWKWMREAKKYSQIIGFAIGRTIFLQAVLDYFKGKISQDEAIENIASNYQTWIDRWETME